MSFGFLTIFVAPILLVFQIVARRRKFVSKMKWITSFMLYSLPGAIAGAVFGYGWYGMLHDKNFVGNVGSALLFFGLIVGFIGVSVDVVLARIEKR